MEKENDLIKQYRRWILLQETPDCRISANARGNIELETDIAMGYVNFYDDNIVELRIDTIREGHTEFFLHFQLIKLSRAKELFHEMQDALEKIARDHQTKILLCCTSGLTTGFFAEKLNQASEAISSDMTFEAVDFGHLLEKGYGYDAVLLAPQVAYEREKVQNALKGALVINIPPAVFGSYDCGSLIAMLNHELSFRKNERTTKSERTARFFETRESILVIAILNETDHFYYLYRWYDQGNLRDSGEIRMSQLCMEGIFRAVDEALAKEDHFQHIGIGVPGTVKDGRLYFPDRGFLGYDMETEIREKYQKNVFVFNDTNMVVTGIYWLEDHYRTIVFYYVPVHSITGGAGIVVNGHLVTGRNNIAGETSYLNDLVRFSDQPEKLRQTKEGTVELIAKTILPMIVSVGPDAVYVKCDDIADSERLRKEIGKMIPDAYVPDVIWMDDVTEFMMTGLFLRCIWKIQNQNRNRNGLSSR